jgi:O-antigen ligase
MRIVLCSMVLLIGAAAATSFGSVASMLGKSASMSGRTDIYREVWAAILKSPILGYGYGGFWGVSPEATRIGLAIGWTGIGYSENGILELALQLGIAGVGLVLWMIARAVVQGVRLLRSPHYQPRTGWYLAILCLAALSNIDAGWLLSTGTLDWAMILIACIGLNAQWRRARDARVAYPPFMRELSQDPSPLFVGDKLA